MKHLTYTIFIVLTSYFLGMSIFFTINVYNLKKSFFKPADKITIQNKTKVKVVKIVDGDEIVINYRGDNYLVRILGIKSYETSINDFSVHHASQYSIHFLKKQLVNKIIELQFLKYKTDSHKRILAYVYLKDKDIGLEMVQKGLTLVFTKYPFSKIKEYLQIEKIARKKKLGIWSVPKLLKRSLMQKIIWKRVKKK